MNTGIDSEFDHKDFISSYCQLECFVSIFSCQGDTVVSILIDLHSFYDYENREVLVQDHANVEDSSQV